MIKKIMVLIAILAIAVPCFAAMRNGTMIKKDMPSAGTYVAIGIANYLPCYISAINCYQKNDMYISYDADGTTPILIPGGSAYFEMDAQQDREIYATGTVNGDDVCAVIYK